MRYLVFTVLLSTAVSFFGCMQSNGLPASDPSEGPNPVAPTANDSVSVPTKTPSTTKSPSGPVAIRVVDEQQFRDVVSGLKGKVVLIDFWGSWCVPCLELLPHTLDAAEKYGQRGFMVVTVAIDDPSDIQIVEEKLSQRGGYVIPLVSKYGVSSDSVEKLGISDGALPHLKLLDRSGEVVETFGVNGTAPTPENINAAIERVLDSSPAAN